MLGKYANLHAAVIKQKQKKRRICKSMNATMVFSKTNGLNSRANILSASNNFDPPNEI